MEKQQKQGRKLTHTVIEILVCVAIVAGLVAYAIPIFLQAQDLAKSSNTQEQAKIIGDALRAYCAKNDGHLPPADRWCDALQPHIAADTNYSLLTWQRNDSSTEPYAMVRAMSGVNVKSIKHPERTVAFFEIAERKPNVSGDLSMQVPAHGKRKWNVVVMADGNRKLIMPPVTDTR